MRNWVFVWVVIALIGSAGIADVVILKDGSRIVGEVRRLADGKLLVATDFAGALRIDVDKIAGVATDGPVFLEFPDGDRLRGVLGYDGAGQALDHADAAGRDAAIGSLSGLWALPTDSPEAIRESAEKAKWTYVFELGLNGETGNSERLAFNGGFVTTRETPGQRLMMYARARYAEDNGDRSVNELLGGIECEADISENWFAFGQAELENDEFENLDLRATATAGVGRFFIRRAVEELKLRGGVGYQHESFRDDVKRDDAVGKVKLDYMRKIRPWLDFNHHTTYYPSLEATGEYRLVMENAVVIPISTKQDWKIRMGLRSQYNAVPEGDAERLDSFYFLNLQLNIK